MNVENYSFIGKRQINVDAVIKASGEAEFAGDLVKPKMLIGKMLGSPHPHAKVLNIDATEALALRGVKGFVTGADVPGKKFGTYRSRRDERGLALKARYIGDPVAAVAAVDEETALEAIDLIKVDYEVLPAVFDPEEAMGEGAPLVHDEYEKNIVAHRGFDFGDVEAGFREADHIREDRFYGQSVTHGAVEPRGALAQYDMSGKLTLWTSTQVPYKTRKSLARALAIPESKIRIIKPHVGGGFGGKGELGGYQVAASLLAMKTGRPVRICMTREEEIAITKRRASMVVDVKTGVKKDGTIVAQIAAEELGIPVSDVTVLSGDTETTPIDPGTFSSRVTFYAGNATLIAARQVKDQLSKAAAKLMEANAQDLVFRDKKVFVKGSPSRSLFFGELARTAIGMGHGRLIIGQGHWAPTNTQFPDRKTRYGNVSGAYSFAAQVAEVEVDIETGRVKLLKLTIGDDCGQVINLLGAEGQADGSIAMGMGQALMEDVVFGDNGQIMNPSFLDYKIPTTQDCGDTALLVVGRPDPVGPYGAKEIGEGLIIATVPAICNAIYDAVGVRIKELPVTPEKILAGLEKVG